MSSASLTQDALGLPLQERVRLAQVIWASIDEQLAETDPTAAVLVARERDAEFETGQVAGVAHEEVMRRARERLG